MDHQPAVLETPEGTTEKHQICHIPFDWLECSIEKRETSYDKALCGADITGRVSHSRASCENNPLHSRCVVCLDLIQTEMEALHGKS